MLSSLSILYSDERHQIQQESLETLFQLLHSHASNQSVEFWKIIIRGVFRPLFDEIQFASASNKTHLAITKIAFDHLNVLVPNNFSNHFFPDLLEIYVQLLLSNQDHISLLCLDSLHHLLDHRLDQQNWHLVVNQLTHVIHSCHPHHLFAAADIDTDFTTPINVLLQREDLMIKQFGIKLNVHES